MKKLIFRTSTPPPPVKLPEGISFRVASNAFSGLKLAPALMRQSGFRVAVKMVVKVATGSRAFYALVENGRTVSDGWIMFGHCKAYKIGPCDHVIGPINTISSRRGRGLAHMALVEGVAYSLSRGAQSVYIDTTEANIASLRVIEKSGFALWNAG